MSFYPVYLNLQDKPVLVVGAGEIAVQKITALLDAGAQVHVVAPEADPTMEHLAREKKIDLSRRGYRPSDMDGVRLVIAATDDTTLQPQIAEEARRRGLWVNVVDVPSLCDFIAPAIVRRGDVQIAVSTGGAAPALSKYLRQKLEAWLGPEYEQFAALVKHLRPDILKLPKARRRALWDEIVNDSFFEQIRREGPGATEARLREKVNAA